MNTKKVNTIAMFILAGLITSGFFTLLFLLIFKAIPEQNSELLNISVGALIGAFTGGVVGYFFGSSAGSAQKNEMFEGKNNQPQQ
jgi:hypothetical protein